MSPRPPSIAGRLARALGAWTLLWGAAVGLAIWLAATHEVDELLDDTLASSAELLVAVLREHGDAEGTPLPDAAIRRFAWQLVDADGRVRLRSPRAPQAAWREGGAAGLATVPGWRVYGLATGREGRMLYAAQSLGERQEARLEVALAAIAAAVAVGLLGHFWLRAHLRDELQPLQRLSMRLHAWDPGAAAPPLGAPERAELAPFHAAIDLLAARLAARLANERAFAAHAAHALRTPLAGIDAQLAVALRETDGAVAERLQRVRGAAARLQAVVAALLALFRSGDGAAALQRRALDLRSLLGRLPGLPLAVAVSGGATLDADPDLLLAALVNLLDNAARAGAAHATLQVEADALTLHDDGPGVPTARREALRAALADADNQGGAPLGLGLLLAARVARVHGGALSLPEVERGFAVRLQLGPGPGVPGGGALEPAR
ncbi:MAG: HAMP domain-containing histidine kinase [Rubrivivax sp.]|nr:HAMP domain-containing histidine kinase [Rubrivivax sp.]